MYIVNVQNLILKKYTILSIYSRNATLRIILHCNHVEKLCMPQGVNVISTIRRQLVWKMFALRTAAKADKNLLPFLGQLCK